MKNKIKFKRYLKITFLLAIILLGIFSLINIYEYQTYTKNFNKKIADIVGVLETKYPKLTENDIIEILNSNEFTDLEIFKKYGIDINNKSIIIENEKNYYNFLIINLTFLIISILLLILIFILYNKNKDKDLKNIIKYIEAINKKNYDLNIDSISEDELSILKNEIYKVTIMLKEAAENSNLDKLNLKKSLEDISHQLKTPLTSILVMLDNLIDDNDMTKETQEDFLHDIKREVVNLNFLVQALLKLSKFDANTISFIKEEVPLKNIIEETIKNVATLCDLKNIKIQVKGNNNVKIKCDSKWQIEALTNILKNCVEHSYNNEKIIINFEENKAYSMIEIKDFGEGISKKDLKHIFERFYKGENSSSDSIGIGLALAKTIIEEDNGTIDVKSNEKETSFIIKYFKL